MRILVIGRTGQVARALVERASPDHEIVALGRPDVDLFDLDTIERQIDAKEPKIVINAAAYTAVDKAEAEPELAMAVNGLAPGHIAAMACARDLPFIHLSTDYVFSGEQSRPYRETDATGPLSAYGRSKLAGEEAVRAEGARSLIVRTCWVYSAEGHNFANTMLRLAGEGRDVVRVVDDQQGCPTLANDIADTLLFLAGQSDNWRERALFHFSNDGVASWAEFAEEIFRLSHAVGMPSARVERIETVDYPTPARRPRCSALDTTKLTAAFGIRPRHWRDALVDYFSTKAEDFTGR